ncbi:MULTISPECIES: hypothetical protein [Clostridium]|uniref:Uncharacterized protein n=1 Tax=Clostridium frigoriphilum TaxID=443253 RepID=A0ABU7UUB1_9CLOT|nr:hypothetical protein [Clostridium sp. DSM 17811]MBU3101897.1 hypothetical protein [Clostridium sp. DSM 17811]
MEMLKELNPIAAFNISSLQLTSGLTGDGIKAAKKIGAEIDLISTVMIFDRGAVKPGKVWCSIFDSNWIEDVLKFHTIGCSRVVIPEDNEKYSCNFNVKKVKMRISERHLFV